MAGIKLVVARALLLPPRLELPQTTQPAELLPDGPQIGRSQFFDAAIVNRLADFPVALVFEQLIERDNIGARPDELEWKLGG